VRGPAVLTVIPAILASAGTAAPPPEDPLALYRTANSYEISASRRSCADAALLPRLAAARQRMRAAERRLSAAYGAGALRRNQVPLMVVGDPCANPAAAANALANFDDAVARLETALAGRRRR
jgi:hypothetical protein